MLQQLVLEQREDVNRAEVQLFINAETIIRMLYNTQNVWNSSNLQTNSRNIYLKKAKLHKRKVLFRNLF